MGINRPGITGREYNKFVESPTRPGEPAVEISGAISGIPGPFAAPSNCDYILRSVTGTVETYTYFNGGVSGTLLKTIVATYTDLDLTDLTSVEVL